MTDKKLKFLLFVVLVTSNFDVDSITVICYKYHDIHIYNKELIPLHESAIVLLMNLYL
jgi:hypothetical protein